MGPYVFVSAMLVGFFAFACLHYGWQWWLSRRETTLLIFSVHCALCGLLSGCIVGIATAETAASISLALRGRATVGLLILVTSVHLFSHLTGLRARRYVAAITVFFPILAAVNSLFMPLHRSATQFGRLVLPWGEEISVPVRAPAEWWHLPLYMIMASVVIFGLLAARRLWTRDRIGGALVGLASAAGLLSVVFAVLADIVRVNLPYIGSLPVALWVPLIALLQSREYAHRNERLAATERRFRAIFDQTFQFIGLLTLDGTLLKANRTALEFAGSTAQDVIGKKFWDTQWWSHSPELQEKLRQAVAAAGQGEFVRFEATHPAADGTIHHVDFSLKPVRNESGDVVLLIPEGRDITVWKEAEAALQKSQASLRTFIDSLREASEFNRQIIASTSDGLIVLDREFRYQVWNPAMERISGLSAADVIGKRPLDLFPFLEEMGVIALAKRALAGETISSPDFPYKVPQSGREGWLSHSLGPLCSADGSIVGVITTVRDVTDRIQVEKSLRESEARYRTLVEHAPEAIVVLDVDLNTFVDVNENACRLFGMSREEVMRHGPLDLSPALQPDGRSSIDAGRDNIEKALAGESPRFEWIHRNSQGRDVSCEVFLVRLPSATRQLVRGSLVDITERKQAEETLRRKDIELRRVIESNMIGIVFWTKDGIVSEANDYFLSLVGFDHEDLAAGKIDWNALTPPEYRSLDQQCLLELAERGSCTPYEKQVLATNGSRVPVLVGAARFDGGMERGVAFVLDLSQRKRLEEQFRQSQKMQAVGQLAGGVAHDFNNLLTIIFGYATNMLDALPPSDPMHASMKAIIDACQRAASLTRQLLVFSRRQVLQPMPLNLNDVVRHSERLLRRLIGEDVNLTVSLDPNLGSIQADPSQLEQVLMNLAVNARDAMSGGGRLTIETRNVSLDEAFCLPLTDVHPGPFSLLVVSDTGAGMDEATRARIFEPFFTTKEPGKGTGLGLATVHGIIKQSGGHIEVESEPGRGATFNVYLPQVDQAPSTPEFPPADREMPHGHETVLLVEDEHVLRMLVRRILQDCGYVVLEAKDTIEALEIARTHAHPIDLLATDMVMPQLSGKELVDQIMPLRPACKVLYLSGYTDDDVIQDGVQAAEFGFLQKPFTPVQMAQKVREVLDARG